MLEDVEQCPCDDGKNRSCNEGHASELAFLDGGFNLCFGLGVVGFHCILSVVCGWGCLWLGGPVPLILQM